MPSRAYDGSVSIIQNTAGTIVIEADSAGAWSNDNVVDCYAKMLSLAKEHNAPLGTMFYGYEKVSTSGNKWQSVKRKSGNLKTDTLEIKEYTTVKEVDGEEVVIGSGKPYMSLTPPQGDGKSGPVKKIKLA